MTNYTKTPDERPWARDLSSGDRLTTIQGDCVCAVRLSDFNLQLRAASGGYIVTEMTAHDHRLRRLNSCGNRGYA